MRSKLLLAISALSLACGEVDEFTVPPPPAIGVQIQLQPVTIQPGEDLEFCTYFNLETPARARELGRSLLVKDVVVNGVNLESDTIAFDRIEVYGAPGLHHIQVLHLANDTEDSANKHILECAVDLFGGPLTGDVDPLFFTSRNAYEVHYPHGVARVLQRVTDKDDPAKVTKRGPQLLYNFHYVNPTEEPITAEVAVNLSTVDPKTVVHRVESAWWNYVYFKVQNGAQVTADAHGSFRTDVALVGLTSHQHRTGTLFTYDRGGTELYRNTRWAEPEYQYFPEGTVLRKDEPLGFRCQWDNQSGRDLYFGLQADDEMCTAIVEYYPTDPLEAERVLAALRMEHGDDRETPFSSPISLEQFLAFPDEVVARLENDPGHALDILDHDIICGIATNMKEMERQYGRPPDTLRSLSLLVEFLAPVCDLR